MMFFRSNKPETGSCWLDLPLAYYTVSILNLSLVYDYPSSQCLIASYTYVYICVHMYMCLFMYSYSYIHLCPSVYLSIYPFTYRSIHIDKKERGEEGR